IENTRSIHMNGDFVRMCPIAYIAAMCGRHYTPAGKIMRIFKTNKAGRAGIIRLVYVQGSSNFVPCKMTGSV
ncbi:hypothetical protein OFD71_35955, partial [Escherichia coli]|nr:hypothetical protein [Escherichia coli]